MSSEFLIIAGVGAVVAAVGSGVLIARCLRGPRVDLAAFSVALIGLLISLGSQTLGYLDGFNSDTFRGMELGAQVVAPLALIVALSEVAGRTLAARFCARVYIPAIGIVALVVLSLDQLASGAFSKAWPDPAVFFGIPPRWVLMFAIGPITALVAVIAIITVGRRADKRGWDAVLPAQFAGGVAALLLAYPALAMLATYFKVTNLPVQHVFTLICAAAAVMTWFAGVHIGRMRIAVLQGRGAQADGDMAATAAAGWGDGHEPWDSGSGGGRDGRIGQQGRGPARRPPGYDRPADSRRDSLRPQPEVDQTGDIGGPYRPEEDGGREDDYGWHTRDDRYAGRGRPGPRTRHDDAEEGVVATGDLDLGAAGADWDTPAAGADRSRADLFGQIAIYTLLEDRVQEFDQLTERVVERVRASEQDTLVFIVHAVPSAPMQRILYEVYRDRGAYEWHRKQSYVLQFEADRRPYVLATNIIELGLQQAKVSPFPSVSELFGEPGYDTSGFERPDYLRDYGRPPASRGGSSW